MARAAIDVNAAPDVVWSVLADAAAYGEWVVGTKHITRADANWPEPGTQLEYALGIGPIAVGDRTVVLESDRPHVLVLRAEIRRLGAATIRLRLEPHGESTRVLMDEAPVEGVIDAAHTSISDAALKRRNELALGRLKRLAEARA